MSSSSKCGYCLPEVSIENPKFSITHTKMQRKLLRNPPGVTGSWRTLMTGFVCLFTATIKICKMKCDSYKSEIERSRMIPKITIKSSGAANSGYHFDLSLPSTSFWFNGLYAVPPAVIQNPIVDYDMCEDWKQFCCEGTKKSKSSSLTGLGPLIENKGVGGKSTSEPCTKPCCDQLLNLLKKEEECFTLDIDCPFTVWDKDYWYLPGPIEDRVPHPNINRQTTDHRRTLMWILNTPYLRNEIAKSILSRIGNNIWAAIRQAYSNALEEDPANSIQECWCEQSSDDDHCCVVV